jgi:hypothetical protein
MGPFSKFTYPSPTETFFETYWSVFRRKDMRTGITHEKKMHMKRRKDVVAITFTAYFPRSIYNLPKIATGDNLLVSVSSSKLSIMAM